MSSGTTALVVAGISSAVSVATAIFVTVHQTRGAQKLEEFQSKHAHELAALDDLLIRQRDKETRTTEAEAFVARYRNPLLQSASDLQSRLYNVLRPGGFKGGRDPEYFVLNTVYLFAQYLGWVEIIRRELQFVDLGAVYKTKQLGNLIERIRNQLANTERFRDEYYIYRGQQRAIGELMMVSVDGASAIGPRHECMGYGEFVAKHTEVEFQRWLGSLERSLARLRLVDQRPERLFRVQSDLLDLVDFLDPVGERIPGERRRLWEGYVSTVPCLDFLSGLL